MCNTKINDGDGQTLEICIECTTYNKGDPSVYRDHEDKAALFIGQKACLSTIVSRGRNAVAAAVSGGMARHFRHSCCITSQPLKVKEKETQLPVIGFVDDLTSGTSGTSGRGKR